ncbi:MAG: LON peptidase substrate-binding domain-containing protein [Chloroflexi bacterium]|nr:LON peptidase substrate-binding domain-containing protein [Chloroflexota bacterium]
MQKLPLFPLNSVLFPEMPISLHIFEERYKLMIGRCIEERKPFGVVLIRSGEEVLGAGPGAEPHLIGCTAEITQVQRLPMGRLNIVAMGKERFQILALQNDEPYLTGTVEMAPLVNENPVHLDQSGLLLRPWVERYLNVLGQAENVEFDMEQLPKEPLPLAYLAASLLRVDLDDKQDLLTIESAAGFLQGIRRIYRKEVTLLEALMTQPSIEEGPFSVN